ncbi:MAG: 30S ribosomal protein S8 [Patescibacteria group bacterium]
MYIDLLTKIKNAQAVKKESIKVSYSKMDERVLEILKENNFIKDFDKKGRGAKRIIEIELKYNKEEKAISGIKLISKPSLRLYIGYKDIKQVRNGYGLLVVSTPKGVITGREAKKIKVGGEMLFKIW